MLSGQNRQSDASESQRTVEWLLASRWLAGAGPQLGAFDAGLVDGNLLLQGNVLGGPVLPGRQKRADQNVNRLSDAHEKVSQVVGK